MTDPYVGRLTFIRIYTGTLDKGTPRSIQLKIKERESLACFEMHANQRKDRDEFYTGDIAACIGLKYTSTGDTLCIEGTPLLLEKMEFPEPVISMAIEPKSKADRENTRWRFGALSEEDPTFRVQHERRDRSNDHLWNGRASPRDSARPYDPRIRRRSERRQT